MDDMVKLENRSTKIRTIYETGTGVAYNIGPGVTPFPEKIANQFLAEFPGDILIYHQVDIPTFAGDPIVWIANATGNPFVSPKEILVNDKTYPHPLRDPRPLSWVMHRDQIPRVSDSGPYDENQVPVTIVLPAFERLPVSKRVADFVLQRDAWAQWLTPPGNGRVVLCRAPTSFEPNITWSIADMRLYAKMMNPEFFTKARMESEFPPEQEYRGEKDKIAQGKRKLFEHLFHMLISDDFSPVTREGFELRKRDLEEKAKRA